MCRSGHRLAEWTWRCCAHLVYLIVCHAALLLPSLTHPPRCTACSFSDVCDKKRHEVSPGQAPRSDGEWSRHIWLFSTNQSSTLAFSLCPCLLHREQLCFQEFVCRMLDCFCCCFCPFAARGGNPQCEEGTACLVLPLMEFLARLQGTAVKERRTGAKSFI